MSRQLRNVSSVLAFVLAVCPSVAAAQSRAGAPPASSSKAGGDGPVRTKAKKAGVIDPSSGKKKINFDPATGASDTDKVDELTKDAEDVIEWKTNFEKGIKCKKLPLDTKIRLDFNDIALGDLTKFISCITEQNFILAGGANKSATVSILSPKPVTAYEAYKAYLSTLEANSLTIVPNGNFLEIVPSGEAKQQGAPIFGPSKKGPNDDRMVTRLIQLEHIEGQEILPVIEKFKTKSADLTIYAPTNTLIVTDTGSNIRRLLTLIEELDVPVGKEKIWIRPIQYAEAAEILSMLQNLFQASGSTKSSSGRTSSPKSSKRKGKSARTTSPSSVVGNSGDLTSVSITKMLSDERTNSIIFVASRTSYLKVDRLLRKLDVPIPGEGQIHIHGLENADAEEIAQTLSSLASSSGRSKGKRSSKSKEKSKSKSKSSSSGGALLQGDVKITAYEPTNSLVIESSLKDYLSLQKVIKQLDVRRKQVYVEAIIMEISQNKQKDVGLSGSGGIPDIELGGEQVPLLFGVGGLGLDVQGALSTLTAGGGAIGMQGPMVDLSGGVSGSGDSTSTGGSFSIPAFGFTLQALATTSNVNVLSTPHILTVENEEAEIQVGKRQPYRNSSMGGLGGLSSLAGLAGGGASSALGSLGSLGSLGGLGSQVQYVDVDLTLKIKPQVNASDFVRLEIEQNIDDIEGFFAEAPITSKRKISNIVVVRDGQPVVIGGLMRDSETESVEKVPFLGDIPLLGMLFRRTSTTVEKRNLLLIIIPHVIKDPSDLKQIHEQRQKEYRDFSRMLAMRKKEFTGELDYRKKVGLLQSMHITIDRARRDRELNEQAIFESTEFDSVGPPETHDIEYDPYESGPAKDGE
jgi:general secretion pathway protein D